MIKFRKNKNWKENDNYSMNKSKKNKDLKLKDKNRYDKINTKRINKNRNKLSFKNKRESNHKDWKP